MPWGLCEESWACRAKSQALRCSGGRCVEVYSARQALRRFSPLEVRLHRPRSAVHRSGGPCVQVLVTTQAPHRSSPCEVTLRRSGSTCGEFLTTGQAVRRF
ncbi:hypothetical protein NDU88_004574 [Pleurodeles waltl]|uniref:Uncharacterized protein n=1 Tax=Pleurodeles waltl TaxID=8319 RepID=A0AAV7T8W1_PLEWA|nr:hypothetical protein NDU88_004574 [Pleurodeles waltl]